MSVDYLLEEICFYDKEQTPFQTRQSLTNKEMIADFVCLEEYVHNIIWRSGSESKQIYDKLTFGKR